MLRPGLHPTVHALLPLPPGEGWGEGASPPSLPHLNQRNKNSHRLKRQRNPWPRESPVGRFFRRPFSGAHMNQLSLHHIRLSLSISLALIATPMMTSTAHAQASEASALSLLPIAVLSAAPVAILASGVDLTVSAVEASVDGTTWVLARASDGAKASVKLAGNASVAVGTSVAVTAMAAGYVLSTAGRAVAFIPNELGASLLYNERVSR